jgi:hypothetical protein
MAAVSARKPDVAVISADFDGGPKKGLQVARAITCGNNNAIYVLDTTNSSILGHITSDYPGGLAIAPLT